MFIYKLWQVGLTTSLVLLLVACSSQRVMMPTPNIHVGSDATPYETLPQELKSTQVPLFYVTDRVAENDENGRLKYGFGRSPSLAFGSAVVDLGEDISWEELLDASRAQKRLKKVPMKVQDIHEISRGPNTPIPYTEIDGVIVEDPEYLAKRLAQGEIFRKSIVTLEDRRSI